MLLVASNMQEYADRTEHLLESGEIDAAVNSATRLSALHTARILTEAPIDVTVAFIRMLNPEQAAPIIGHFPLAFTASVLKEFGAEEAAALVAEMAPEKLTDILPVLPDELAEAILLRLDPDHRYRIETLAAYPPDTAGSVMSPNYLSIEPDTRVRDVIEAVRSAPREIERTAYIFVVTPRTGTLQGVISLRELMLSNPVSPARDIMTREVFAIRANDNALEAARRIRSRRLKMIPVVDEQDAIVGIISIGQAMDLLSHEMADEFVAMNAASPDESFYTSPPQAVRKRLPWMAANIFLNLGAVWIISSFENTIVQVAILAAFLPMITDMGGNVGIQALSVSIRSIALGEARLIDFWKAMRKELAIGLMNGLALGVLFSAVAFVLQGNFVLGVIAGFALACNVLLAGVVGGTIPFLIKRMGKDPALMTGPILTTITDITGVSIYLGLATLFLGALLV